MISRVTLGFAINVEIWLFLVVNVLCLYCIGRGKLYSIKGNPAYLITTFNLITETMQLLLHFFYIGPSILFGDWFFSEGQKSLGVAVVSFSFLTIWFVGTLTQILMAANRLVVVFYPGRNFLTAGIVKVILIVLTIVAISLGSFSQLISPCCRITPDFHYYSYSYLVFENQTVNYSMMFVDQPIDVIASVMCALSYTAVFIYVYQMEKSDTVHKKREIKLCIQFLLMFVSYTITWLTFFFFPSLGITQPEAYSITVVNLVANCGVNGVIYLTMNREVKKELHRLVTSVSPASTVETQHM